MYFSNHRQSYYIFVCITLSLMLFMFCGCKKESAGQQDSRTAPTTDTQAAEVNTPKDNPSDATLNNNDSQPTEATAPKTDAENIINVEGSIQQPDAAQAVPSKKCEKWGTNPMFEDGHVFNYEVTIEKAACCDLDKDDPEWQCDKDGMCELNKTVNIQCKTLLTHTQSYFCASTITCKEQNGNDNFDFPAGHWFIDSNGIYRFISEKTIFLNKQATPGNCKKTENIQCKPETLAYDYTEFADEDPLFPFVKSDIHHDECDEEGEICDAFHLTHKGTIWERESSANGGDNSSDSMTLDETRGLTAFKNDFSGGSELHIEGKLK